MEDLNDRKDPKDPDFDAEQYIADLPLWAKQKNSPEAVARFLREELPETFSKIPVIHIAGTNGKGSVSAYLTRALLDSGLHVGTFISPHLVSVRERILLDNVPVSLEIFREAALKVKAAAERFTERGGVWPAYFEYLYYMAVQIFSDCRPDAVVLETGLGGRLDATNSCMPVLSVITSISRDHMQYLGETIPEIAAEKAGIIKPGIPVVYDCGNKEAEQVILAAAKETHSAAYPAGAPETAEHDPRYQFLPAAYQRRNAAVAEEAWKVLKTLPCFAVSSDEPCSSLNRSLLIPAEQFPESVRRARWAGRMDEVLPDVFLDGGHNEDGMRAMCEGIRAVASKRGRTPVMLTAASGDKDAARIVPMTAELLSPRRVIVTAYSGGRSMDPEVLADLYRKAGIMDVRVIPNVKEAWAAALSEKKEDELLISAGSLYLVGEIMSILNAPMTHG